MVIENHFCERNVQEILDVTIVQADNSSVLGQSEVTVEHIMEIFLNERLIVRLVCTPDNLEELVMGRLLSSGYITGQEDVECIYICENGQRAKVYLSKEIVLEESMKVEQTCCTANRQIWNPQDNMMKRLPKAYYSAQWIFGLADEFAKGSKIHKRTKGTHSCILMYDGKIVYGAEDIGRHNALDKALGFAVINGYEREKCILFTSGRIPVDMAEKVVRAKIPVLVSKAVPTNMAVRMAKEYNLTLICKAWQDSYEVFFDAEE